MPNDNTNPGTRKNDNERGDQGSMPKQGPGNKPGQHMPGKGDKPGQQSKPKPEQGGSSSERR